MLSVLVTLHKKEVTRGVGVYASNMVDGLCNRVHEVSVIMPPGNADRKDVEFIFAPPSRYDPTPNKWLSFSHNAARMYELFTDKRFEIVHFTDAKEALFFPPCEIPMVGNVHDCYLAMATKNPLYYRIYYSADWVRRYFYYNLARILEKRAVSKLTAIISNSEFVSASLDRLYGIQQNKIKVIYQTINLSRFKALSTDKKRGRAIILLVGGNLQRKGLPLLARAASRVLGECPSAQFHVIGNDPNMGKMKKLCQDRGVGKAFYFLGYVDNEGIGDYYQKADVFVMPSLVEAFGLVFLEAMASGTPVIGSNVGGTKELIEHRKNGLLVDPNNSDQLAEYILELLNDRELRARVIKEGYKTVRKYDMNNMIDETVDFYGDLLHV